MVISGPLRADPDPIRLVRMVNQIGELSGPLRADPDPIRLVRMVNQIGELSRPLPADPDPIRLVRMVKVESTLGLAPQSFAPSGRAGWGRDTRPARKGRGGGSGEHPPVSPPIFRSIRTSRMGAGYPAGEEGARGWEWRAPAG
jgi:hypothetical protein